jgi:Tol biopolymer transport system component
MTMRIAAAGILAALMMITTGCASRVEPPLLAYVARTGGAQEVYLYDTETGQTRQLTFTRGLKGAPAFSADGNWVLYACDVDGDWEIYRVPAEGGDTKQLTRNLTPDLFPAPGIRDESVVFLAVDDTGPVLRHLDDPDEPGSVTSLHPDLDPAPDGLVLDRTGGLAACVYSGDIRLADLRSTFFRHLVEDPADDADPAFSADSRALVFASDREGSYDLYVVDLERGEPVRLTSDAGDERHPVTDADNQTVYFYGEIGGRRGVYRRAQTPAGTPPPELVFVVEGELTGLALWP